MKNKFANVRQWYGILRDVRSEADQRFEVAVAGHAGAAGSLSRLLGEGSELFLSPVIQGHAARLSSGTDTLLLVLSGDAAIEHGLARLAADARRRGIGITALVDETGLEAEDMDKKLVEMETAFGLGPGQVLFYSPGMGHPEKAVLLARLAAKAGDKAIALAASVPAFRPAVAKRAIDSVAGQNAWLSVASLIPAADFPVLTANQVRMVLKIAAVYGLSLSVERALELLAVFGGGLVFRTLARQAVGFIPFAGWAVKGAVAYAGTRAIGMAAERYFKKLGDEEIR